MKENKFSQYITFKNVLILGVLITLGITFQQLLTSKAKNFEIFTFATLDFWDAIKPYGEHWFRHGLDYYLYTPTFNVVFTPFALLPLWVSAFAWNLFNYLMLAWSIKLLPNITTKQKSYLLLYLTPIIATSLMSFQYNVVVAYLFLFPYVLLERGKGCWAMLLIMLSVTTKIYGGVELLIVLFYPKFWRNVGWGILWAVALVALPLINLSVGEYGDFLSSWVHELSTHQGTRKFETFFDITLLWESRPAYQMYMQVGIFFTIVGLTFARLRWRTDQLFRVGVLALVMGYAILFSNSSEKHTYMIALAGYLYWWYLKPDKNLWDRIIFWVLFVVLVVIPIDLICPKPLMELLLERMDLNQWVYLVAWLHLAYHTFFVKNQNRQIKIK
ncbi:MAG: glycosyltransferase family 87 protein [Rikenellaceae bacterium]